MAFFAFDDLYVRRLKEHDRVTEDHFYEYFRPLLFKTLSKSLPAQDIDDVIQDVFIRVLSRLHDVRDGHRFGAFVLGFCRNIVLERYREKRPEPLTDEHEQIVDKKSNTEEQMFSEEAAAAVHLTLSKLPERDASLLREFFLTGEERKDLCRRFDVSPEYLGVLLHRARKRFTAAYRKLMKKKK
jgi:RNA polymerase sigma-70 factor (ECF subfamily)